MTVAEYKSEFEPTKTITYLALTGELWDVLYEDFGENRWRYIGSALYNELTLQTIQFYPIWSLTLISSLRLVYS